MGTGEIDLASYIDAKDEQISLQLQPTSNHPSNMKIMISISSYNAGEEIEEIRTANNSLNEDENVESKDKDEKMHSDENKDHESFIPSTKNMKNNNIQEPEMKFMEMQKKYRDLFQIYNSTKTSLEKVQMKCDKLKNSLTEKDLEIMRVKEDLLNKKNDSEFERQVEKLNQQLMEKEEKYHSKCNEIDELNRKYNKFFQQSKSKDIDTENKLKEFAEKDNKILQLTSQVNALKEVTKTLGEKLMQHDPHRSQQESLEKQAILELSSLSSSAFYPFALVMFIICIIVMIVKYFTVG